MKKCLLVPLSDSDKVRPLREMRSAALVRRPARVLVAVASSQSGAFGWLLADARPKLVMGIVAIEPNGPPFQNAVTDENKARPWGLTDIPLTYSPSARAANELKAVREPLADGPELTACWKQADPPRGLTRLQGIPVLVVTTQSSYHAAYDHCTAKYLTQAGVTNTFLRLEDQGIFGNGHMVMLEKNNLAVAALLQKWISGHIK